MDPKHGAKVMLAPGASASTPPRCPGGQPDPWPAVDDHLVKPEVTRDEMIRGRVIQAMPANPPHADRQGQLAYVLGAHVRPGYVMSTELLTRVAPKSDFATDACVRKAGQDPATGRRYLEELAFEVVSEQHPGDILAKAEDMSARGVRRVFAVFIKTGEVKEWLGAWQALPPGGSIEDAALARPLPARAILDAAEADNAVVRALAAKGNPALAAVRQEGHKEGRAAGQAEALLTVLSARGFAVSAEVRARILGERDPATLQRWIGRAVAAPSLQEVLCD